MRFTLLALTLLSLHILHAQEESNHRSEIGVDGSFSVSNLGGNVGVGLKYAHVYNPKVVFGPSVRFMRSWSSNNNNNQTYGFSILGAGGFFHLRYQNVLFGGAELEFFRTPINYNLNSSPTKLVPTFFLCGGFSKEFNELVRINVGLYYDVINHVNSPFRQGYTIKKTDSATGAIMGYIPLIYRLAFFFPLGKEEK
jgi:hypothetical protein